jgi:nucleotide-binding universal stress UspA family protein
MHYGWLDHGPAAAAELCVGLQGFAAVRAEFGLDPPLHGVVLLRRHRGAFSVEIIIGSVIVRSADMSSMATQVRKEPKESGKPSRGYRKILLGYDGSENGKRALERAIALALAQEATIRVVVAANTILPVYGPAPGYQPPDYADEVIKMGQKSLADALARTKEAGAQASGFVEEGPPAEVILDAADSEAVDLVVVGRRGMSDVKRFLMGSVSSSVLNHSKCDVLVAK